MSCLLPDHELKADLLCSILSPWEIGLFCPGPSYPWPLEIITLFIQELVLGAHPNINLRGQQHSYERAGTIWGYHCHGWSWPWLKQCRSHSAWLCHYLQRYLNLRMWLKIEIEFKWFSEKSRVQIPEPSSSPQVINPLLIQHRCWVRPNLLQHFHCNIPMHSF